LGEIAGDCATGEPLRFANNFHTNTATLTDMSGAWGGFGLPHARAVLDVRPCAAQSVFDQPIPSSNRFM
jgi:hypothetical protein